jgi:Tetracyclin repressor-like, C-terminal domain
VLRPPPALDAKLNRNPALGSWAAAIQPDLPADVATALLGLWTRLHGLVIMETFGHLNWLGSDRTVLMTAQFRAMMAELIQSHQRS